ELVHALQAPELGDRRQQPRQLRVLSHVALAKERAAARIQAGREQDGGRVVAALAQLSGVVGNRDRVQVDDAEDRLASLLTLHVLHDRADVIAQMLAPRGLDAGEDAHAYSACRITGRLAAVTSSRRRTGVL